MHWGTRANRRTVKSRIDGMRDAVGVVGVFVALRRCCRAARRQLRVPSTSTSTYSTGASCRAARPHTGGPAASSLLLTTTDFHGQSGPAPATAPACAPSAMSAECSLNGYGQQQQRRRRRRRQQRGAAGATSSGTTTCVCRLGWNCVACQDLRLPSLTPGFSGYGSYRRMPNVTSWGGTLVQDPFKPYHLCVTEERYGCGMSIWSVKQGDCACRVVDARQGRVPEGEHVHCVRYHCVPLCTVPAPRFTGTRKRSCGAS